MASVLSFGIPELDRMLDLRRPFYVRRQDGEREPSSLALIGSDGTGKSVLALHLASRYFADNYSDARRPKVLYLSTDLKFDKANGIWTNFALDDPNGRHIPCERAHDRAVRQK